MDINTVTPAQLEETLARLSHECEEADREYVLADEEYQVLDDGKKAYFANLTEEAEGKTTAEKERQAQLNPEWGRWMTAYAYARKKARLLRVTRDAKQRYYDTCRSLLSSKNKEWNRQ